MGEERLVIRIRRQRLFLAVCAHYQKRPAHCALRHGRGHLSRWQTSTSNNPSKRECSILRTPDLMPITLGWSHDYRSFAVTDYGLYHALCWIFQMAHELQTTMDKVRYSQQLRWMLLSFEHDTLSEACTVPWLTYSILLQWTLDTYIAVACSAHNHTCCLHVPIEICSGWLLFPGCWW